MLEGANPHKVGRIIAPGEVRRIVTLGEVSASPLRKDRAPVAEKQIGLALVPSDEFIEKYVAFQERAIEIAPSLGPRLGINENLPHLTIFQGAFSELLDHEKLLEVARCWLKKKASPSLIIDRFDFHEPGWYFLMVQREDWLIHLHLLTLEACNPFISRVKKVDPEAMKGYDDLQKEVYEKYRYRYAGSAYAPHITLGYSAEGSSELILKALNDLREQCLGKEIRIGRMTIYRMGERGAHAEMLDRKDFIET